MAETMWTESLHYVAWAALDSGWTGSAGEDITISLFSSCPLSFAYRNSRLGTGYYSRNTHDLPLQIIY
jgi:hypothetical protein